jgi:SDR family mycofactocin-dependent oxidoreductase
MGKLDGRVALITGAARGQGRSHAELLAREGADIIACDICEPLPTAYPGATPEQLEETRALVEAQGRRCIAERADVRDLAQLERLVARGIAELGGVDILLANAGILNNAPVHELSATRWQEMIDTNLTGVFNSIRAVLPHMIERRSGRIVATSSMAGRQAYANSAHYVASKYGVIGLVKATAIDAGPFGITVNAVCPTNCATDMIFNQGVYELFCPGAVNPGPEDIAPLMSGMHPQQVPWIQPIDVSRAILFLVSDDSPHITGEALSVSAGLIAANAA